MAAGTGHTTDRIPRIKVSAMLGVLTAGAALLFCVAALTDLQTRLIPNWIPASLGAAFVAAAFLDPARHPPLWSIAAAIVVFLPLLLGFAAGKMGGGDVKLLTAAALWSGWERLPELLVITALAGGALALLAVLGRSFHRALFGLGLVVPGAALSRLTAALAARLEPPRNRPAGLPYGVAIAAGGLAVLNPFHIAGM